MVPVRACLPVAILLFSTSALAQTTRVVDDDGQASVASCDDAGAAYATPAAAIAAAANGDTVLVCPGTYIGAIDFAGKAITARSVAGPAVTILDGNAAGSVVTFTTGETATSVIEGFTIRNGFASFSGGGIRIYRASPVIRRNVIVNNRGCESPGIASSFGSPLIEENTIAYNEQGGCSGGTIGGGIGIVGASTAVVRRNNIHHNGDAHWGGGIALWAAGTPVIEHNVIWENSAQYGGGIGMVNRADATITGNVVFRNRADEGGGIYWMVPSDARGPLLVNNTIADNDSLRGSGVLADGYDVAAALHNNIVVARAGQIAIHCGGSNDLNPPIFNSNNVYSAAGPAYGGFCLDQTGSNGNISADPLFRDALAGDFHLAAGSPAIDAGNGTAPGLPSVDMDGHARILNGAVDIGADEAAGSGTVPGAFDKTAPTDGASELMTSVALGWNPSAGATSFEFCVDTVDNGSCDGTWQPAMGASPGATVSNLAGGTIFYWQVRAANAAGVTYANGSGPASHAFSTQSRIIALAGNMAFGSVLIGERPTRTLTITNSGSAPLSVRGITYPAGFSGAWSGTIPAGASQDVTVTFSPASQRTYDGDIVVTADQTSGVNVVRASGRGAVLSLSSFSAEGVPSNNATVYASRTVTLVATASGGGTAIEYQFWRYSVATGQWTSLYGYGPSNRVEWTPGPADVGAHYFQVWMRRVGVAVAYDLWRGLGPLAVVMPTATLTGMSCLPASPVSLGASVTCTAAATSPGSVTTLYRFYQYVGQTHSWVMLRDYDSANSVTWTPTAAGTDYVQVWARSAPSAAPYDDWRASPAIKIVPFRLSAPVPNVALPASVNAEITWTIAVAGALPSAQYQFWLYNAGAGTWSVLRGYGTSPSVRWTPGAPGTYAIQAWGRSGASGPMEAWSGTGYFTVVEPTLALVSLTPNVALPSTTGVPIRWTAVANGAAATTRYQFWLYELGGGWTMLQDYSESPAVDWTSTRPGTYWLQAWARKEGSTVAYDTWIGTGAVEVR